MATRRERPKWICYDCGAPVREWKLHYRWEGEPRAYPAIGHFVCERCCPYHRPVQVSLWPASTNQEGTGR